MSQGTVPEIRRLAEIPNLSEDISSPPPVRNKNSALEVICEDSSCHFQHNYHIMRHLPIGSPDDQLFFGRHWPWLPCKAQSPWHWPRFSYRAKISTRASPSTQANSNFQMLRIIAKSLAVLQTLSDTISVFSGMSRDSLQQRSMQHP
jgi:hypothetical protein